MPFKTSLIFAGQSVLLLSLLVTGCSTQKNSNSLPDLLGTQGTLTLAQQAISAYERGDKQRWQSLLCLKSVDYPLTGWSQIRSLVGDISEVKLVNVSEASNAGNGSDADGFTQVVYQVQSQNYPLKTLLLKFFPVESDQCVGLVY
ncbi:hypothetical protein SB766_09865 [Pseudomonas sp. SIMBA_077]